MTIDSLLQTLKGLPVGAKLELVKRLNGDVLAEVSAATEEKSKKTRIAKIAAARDSRDPDFLAAQGILNRAAIDMREITDARAFDRLCAASARPPSTEQRMVVKSTLFRLGVMAD